MDQGSGFELSLLEGMDESLLTRLHAAGIRTREQLGARIAGEDARRDLARELSIPAERLRALHYLNYLLPEERAAHVLELERRLETRLAASARTRWRPVAAFGAGALGLAALLVVLLRPSGPDPALDRRIQRLEGAVEALAPVGISHAEDAVVRELSRLGPAPGWGAGLTWTEEDHRRLERLLEAGPEHNPPRALSIALASLHGIETDAPDSLGPLDRARRASQLLAEFPPVSKVASLWDAAAVLVRARLRSRAFGLDPQRGGPPPAGAALPWSWTAPGYLTCEELLTRLEALPVRGDAVGDWSAAVLQIRVAADLGRSAFAGRPEAYARDYWVRRAELEMAVAAGLAGRSTLLPYSASAPRTFVAERKAYLQGTLVKAPLEARPVLAWLVVEHEEALSLLRWTAEHPALADTADAWVEALAAAEARRHPSAPPDSAVARSVAQALAASGETGDPWAAPRTRREAGVRPLLMEVRAAARSH